MKGKIGFVMFLLGASGLAESSKLSEGLISTLMLIIAFGLIFWEVKASNEKKIVNRHVDCDSRRPYFLP